MRKFEMKGGKAFLTEIKKEKTPLSPKRAEMLKKFGYVHKKFKDLV